MHFTLVYIGSPGANRYKHGFLFLEKFLVCHKNVAFELRLTNQNFLTFTELSVIFLILSNYHKISSGHRWQTLQMALDLERRDSQSYGQITEI